MDTSIEAEKLNLDAFDESINKASGSEIDTLWAILKYKEILIGFVISFVFSQNYIPNINYAFSLITTETKFLYLFQYMNLLYLYQTLLRHL